MNTSRDQVLEYLCSNKCEHRRAFRDRYRVQDLAGHWRNYVAREDRFNRYAEMTSHGPSHVEGVAKLVADLALPFRGGAFLNDSEMFVLNAVARLHDVGMYTTYDPHFVDPMRIRNIHGYLSRETILRDRSDLFPGVEEKAAIELIALLCSYHQGKAALSERDLEQKGSKKRMVLPEIHRLHDEAVSNGEFVQWSLEHELAFAQANGTDLFKLEHTGESVCPFILGVLIKFLDGCDFQVARLGSIESVFRHADRNASHLARTQQIWDDANKPSPSAKRAEIELGFFRGGVFHFFRNLLIEKTFIQRQAGEHKVEIVIKPFLDARVQAEKIIQSMHGMEGANRETVDRLNTIYKLLEDYIADPLKTVARHLGTSESDKAIWEWDARSMKEYSPQNVHYLIALKYIDNEFQQVREAMSCESEGGREWHYCATCPNHDRCPLKERRLPSFVGLNGNCNIVRYDQARHGSHLPGVPSIGYRDTMAPGKIAHHQVTAEERKVEEFVYERKQAVLCGPDGRGKTSVSAVAARRLTKSGTPGVFRFVFDRGADQEVEFLHEFASFLGANGDFLLSNTIRDEEVTKRHQDTMLDILRQGRLQGRGYNFLLLLEDFNKVSTGIEFLKKVIELFPCVSCPKAAGCSIVEAERFACKEAVSYVLLTSTKEPGPRWKDFPIACYRLPALDESEVRKIVGKLVAGDPNGAEEVASLWLDYGGEPFAIALCRQYFGAGWQVAQGMPLFEADMVDFLVDSFRTGLGSPQALEIMKLVSLLEGCPLVADLKGLFKANSNLEEDHVQMLLSRGLLREENGFVFCQSAAWTKGHRRSRWLDRIGTHPGPTIERYLGSSLEASNSVKQHWARIAPYFPGQSFDDISSRTQQKPNSKTLR